MSSETYTIKCSKCGKNLLRDEYSTIFTIDEPEPDLESYGWTDKCPECLWETEHKIVGGLFSQN